MVTFVLSVGASDATDSISSKHLGVISTSPVCKPSTYSWFGTEKASFCLGKSLTCLNWMQVGLLFTTKPGHFPCCSVHIILFSCAVWEQGSGSSCLWRVSLADLSLGTSAEVGALSSKENYWGSISRSKLTLAYVIVINKIKKFEVFLLVHMNTPNSMVLLKNSTQPRFSLWTGLFHPVIFSLFCLNTDLCGHNSLFVAKCRALNSRGRQKGTYWTVRGHDMTEI